MSQYATINIEEGRLNEALSKIIAGLLTKNIVKAVLVPARQPFGNVIMPALISDPAEAAAADPLAPVAPSSAATLLARVAGEDAGGKVAAFLKPCEVRAFLELTKLKQGSLDRTLLVGVDCLGRYENNDYAKLAGVEDGVTAKFLESALGGKGTSLAEGIDIATACKACLAPVAANVDLRLQVIGHDTKKGLGLESLTEAGNEALGALGLATGEEPAGRGKAVEKIAAAGKKAADAIRSEYRDKIKTIDGLMEIIAPCINCYNCRVACPVCYCRECVFVTDTFRHESRQYLGWAEKRGSLRMPADTLFFHLTRMMHISTLCVGCGQCSSACPNDIPVFELFTTVAEGAQSVFGYEPGRDPKEAQPLADFAEDELMEVTGQVK